MRQVIGGKAVKVFEGGLRKVRVAYITNKNHSIGMVNGYLMLRPVKVEPQAPPKWEGPIHAGWANIKHMYPDIVEGHELIGCMIGHPDGSWTGHLDWVQATDEPIPFELPKAN